MTAFLTSSVYFEVRKALADLDTDVATIVGRLGPDQAEAARLAAKLGLVVLFEECPGPDGSASPHLASLYLKIADRSDDAGEALRSLDQAEGEAFRLVAVSTISGMLSGLFARRPETVPGPIRGP